MPLSFFVRIFKENKIEYKYFEPGGQIYSTFSGNNKHASLSRASLATPIVSGITVLLRSVLFLIKNTLLSF